MTDNLNLEKFNPTRGELLSLADEARKLTIAGIDDTEGYKAVHDQRMKLKAARVQIAKTGKEAREEALAFQKKVIAYEKELISIIEPVEEELALKEATVDEEKARLERVALLPSRQAKLAEIGLTFEDDFLIAMDVPAFTEFYDQKKIDWINEREAKFKAEQEKLEADKRTLEEAQRIEAAKKEAETAAQEKAIKDAELAKIRAEEEKQAAVQAEKDRADAEAKRLVEEQARKDKEVKEAEDARIAKEKTDQEALEKKKKYQNFLEKHGYVDDGNFKLEKLAGKVILYKKIGELNV